MTESELDEIIDKHSDDSDDGDKTPKERWGWGYDDLDAQPGYRTENVAAYRCTRCGTVCPLTFTWDMSEDDLPETINALCGTVWGGCMDEWDDDRGNVEMELVSDGFVDWPDSETDK